MRRISTPQHLPLSVPGPAAAVRELSPIELDTIGAVAVALIPADGDRAGATAEPEFYANLEIALQARSDAFEDVIEVLGVLGDVPEGEMLARLRRLDDEEPSTFQVLSTVITGAWLLTTSVRSRIGYPGQQVSRARLEEAVDELESGLLEPVLAMESELPSRWFRGID